MWICLSNAFFSIVSKGCGPDELLVRARRKGDIESVFPDYEVTESHGTDYQFRAVVPRFVVSDRIAAQVEDIQYDNFKNSVRNNKLRDAYSAFWGIHARLQPSPPYSARRDRRQGSLV